MRIVKRIQQSKFDCVIGIGYYFSGFRVDASGEKKRIDMNKSINTILHTIELLNRNEKALKQNWLYVIVNDKSPYDNPIILDFIRSNANSYIYIWLDENVGVGGKENILQTIGTWYSDRVFRVDADVFLMTTIKPLFEAFKQVPQLGCSTINAGYIGNMLTYQNPNQLYISTAQIGNAVMWDTNVLKKIGFCNPELRYFEDLDLVYKAKWQGYASVMTTSVVGKTVSSGCGGTMDFKKQQQAAKLMIDTNPLVTFYLNQKGKPIIYYNKNYQPNIFGMVPKVEPMSKKASEIMEKII